MIRIKVLFVRPWICSFIERDREILEKYYDIKIVDFLAKRDNLKDTINTIKSLLVGLVWADIVFTWFAGSHAYWAVQLSKIFRKKVIVVVGGYEVANVIEIGYGAMLNPKATKQVRYILKNVDKILAVSECNKMEILECEGSADPELVYNGVDIQKFSPGNQKAKNIVLTVGNISQQTITKKGLETFVRAALFVPDVKFVLIGGCQDGSINYLKSIAPKNVEFPGFVSDEILINWYQRATVYCQLSRHESFGVGLAEAMSCECVPVVTQQGALPEVTGDTGFNVPYGEPEATAAAIRKALNATNKGKDARERIINVFNLEDREKKIVSIINNMALIK